MADGFIADDEKVEDAEDRVLFAVHSPTHEMKSALISGEALRHIAKVDDGDLAELFAQHRAEIASEAGNHWLVNSAIEPIVLGRGDFR